MLRSYATNEEHVPDHVVRRLSSAFHELHELYVDGTLSYPYSVRELVNVVRHLDRYPKDGTLQNANYVLFFFDIFSIKFYILILLTYILKFFVIFVLFF